MKLNMDLFDVLEILEKGFDCRASKRRSDTIEKCIKKKSKVIKVVIVEDEWRWSDEKVWAIIHVGEVK
ncbi:MAG: hypothetical protein JSV49_05085 [Thermoplasmata archaeon]|nr:MAG: hypothetical protein JSV49_05085 [Thermoplasmata archaeon]